MTLIDDLVLNILKWTCIPKIQVSRSRLLKVTGDTDRNLRTHNRNGRHYDHYCTIFTDNMNMWYSRMTVMSSYFGALLAEGIDGDSMRGCLAGGWTIEPACVDGPLNNNSITQRPINSRLVHNTFTARLKTSLCVQRLWYRPPWLATHRQTDTETAVWSAIMNSSASRAKNKIKKTNITTKKQYYYSLYYLCFHFHN